MKRPVPKSLPIHGHRDRPRGALVHPPVPRGQLLEDEPETWTEHEEEHPILYPDMPWVDDADGGGGNRARSGDLGTDEGATASESQPAAAVSARDFPSAGRAMNSIRYGGRQIQAPLDAVSVPGDHLRRPRVEGSFFGLGGKGTIPWRWALAVRPLA